MREIAFDEKPSDLPIYTVLIHGDTRCISGDAFIGYQVRTPQGDLQNSKGGSLARLFQRFHGLKVPGKGFNQRKQTVGSEFWAPSMTEDGRLFQNKIIDVIDSGVRACVRIRTVGGLELICTPDHPLADESPHGFTAAQDLGVGGMILVHRHVPWTSQEADKPRINRPEITVKHHPNPNAPKKVIPNSSSGSGDYTYVRMTRARFVYEAHMNGLTLDAYVARLNDGQIAGLKYLTSDIHVHHRDENKLNDVPDNLEALSHAEHSREHFVLPNGRPRSGSYIAVTDVISSITPAGEHQTYDIKMAAPHHNFVADSFIVHNSGKTRFAATWPRPLILADSIEGGYQTVQSMTNDELFESDMPPIIWAIENPGDLVQAAAKMDALIASGRIRTIVFDAFSFYVEFYLAHIIKMQGDKQDTRAAYGDLGKHLRFVRGLIHLKGVNVVWNCLTSHPIDENPKGRPAIPGAQGNAFPAAVSFLLHSRVHQRREAGKIVEETYQLHTRQFGAYMAGHRLGIKADQLPEPFVGDYAQFMTCLGHDTEKIRALLRKNTPIRAAIAAPAQVAAVAAQAKLTTTTIAARPPITNISAPNKAGIPPSSGGNNKPANIVKAK